MDMNYRGECGREGVGRMEWSEGGEWDNCNSIINKYILKKVKKKEYILLLLSLHSIGWILNILLLPATGKVEKYSLHFG